MRSAAVIRGTDSDIEEREVAGLEAAGLDVVAPRAGREAGFDLEPPNSLLRNMPKRAVSELSDPGLRGIAFS